MALFAKFFSDIFILIFVVGPGYLIWKLATVIGNKDIGRDKFEKSIIILLSGIFTNALIITAFSLLTKTKVTRQSIDPSKYAVTDLAQLFSITFILALIFGILSGLVIDKVVLRGSKRKLGSVWDIFFSMLSSSQPVEARIVTVEGSAYEGEIRSRATANQERDLILEWPTKVDNNTGRSLHDVDCGRRMYFTTQGVSHVHYLKPPRQDSSDD